MLLLEMEGKFHVRKVHSVSVPLNRSDKFFDVDLTSLEGNAEFKTLKQLVRMLFFLPFEINKKVSLNLQVCESFQLSFMDHDHKFIKQRAESTFGEQDTGVKMTMIFGIGCKNHPPTVNLFK